MIVLKCFDGFDVVGMSVVVGVDDLTCSDVVVTDDEVVTGGVEVVVDVL